MPWVNETNFVPLIMSLYEIARAFGVEPIDWDNLKTASYPSPELTTPKPEPIRKFRFDEFEA